MTGRKFREDPEGDREPCNKTVNCDRPGRVRVLEVVVRALQLTNDCRDSQAKI